MLKFYQFKISKKAKISNYSPFCVKLELYLRASKIPHKVDTPSGNPTKGAPQGKLPYIEDGEQKLGDSELIINYLNKQYGVHIDSHLNEEQKHQNWVYKKLLEDSLAWTLLYYRWVDDRFWAYNKTILFGSLPSFFQNIIPNFVRKGVLKSAYAQGISRYDKNEVENIARKGIEALSYFLGDKKYFFGDQFSSLDASAYGMLAQFKRTDINPPLNALVQDYPNLVNYITRMTEEFFPERV